MAVSFDRVPPVWTQTRFNSFLNDVETWINSGSAPANFVYPYTYIIKTDGTYYTAYNNAGLPVYGGSGNIGSATGTNALKVLQAVATDAATNGGGKIVVTRGTYDLETTGLTIPSTGDMTDSDARKAIEFICEGQNTVTFTYSGVGVAITIGENNNRHFFYKIGGFYLKQTGTARTGTGILDNAGAFTDIGHIRMREFANSIILDGGYDDPARATMYGYNCKVHDVHAEQDTVGFTVQGRANTAYFQNIISDSPSAAAGTKGIYSTGTQSDVISGDHLYFSYKERGLDIGTREAHFRDIWTEDCTTGIYCSDNTKACYFDQVTITRATTYIDDAGYRNDFTHVHDPINGLKDESWGYITSPADGAYVDHKLMYQSGKNIIQIFAQVFSVADCPLWISDRSATQFQYKYTGGSPTYIWWHAKIRWGNSP
jgi:hypothetical protein